MDIIIAVLGSGALSALIAGAFSLISNTINSKKEDNDKRFLRLETDGIRTQLLVLLSDYPDNTEEIMRVAEHYFYDLKGDWYMTSLFYKWLTDNNIAEPAWFDKDG